MKNKCLFFMVGTLLIVVFIYKSIKNFIDYNSNLTVYCALSNQSLT